MDRPETFRPETLTPMTFKEIARITAGAVASLVIVGWLVILTLALLSAG
jgi:hypothetical protein